MSVDGQTAEAGEDARGTRRAGADARDTRVLEDCAAMY
jgi:hypothetical protein